MMRSASSRDFFRLLPKSDLHVHLRGAMPKDTFLHQWRKYPHIATSFPSDIRRMMAGFDNLRGLLESSARLDPDALFAYRSFDQFLATWVFTRFFFRDKDDLDRLMDGVVKDLAKAGVHYAEITIAVSEYTAMGITMEDILASMEQTARTAPFHMAWIVDLIRDVGPAAAMKTLEELLTIGCDSWIGITIGGSEHHHPPGQFVNVYDRARDAGLHLTAHAGEACGPDSVRDALEILGIERIGHGVRAIEEPALVELLAHRGVPLEVCPSSNISTGIYESISTHPIGALHDAGVKVTVNSDDPTFFATDIATEFTRLLAAGLPLSSLRSIARNGFVYAFAEQHTKTRLLERFDTEWERLAKLYCMA
ncbi:adenosine deaminase [bacterium]|nr:adenosine deaminase [candidate division CSSED10-310 bacterium]